MLTPKSSHFRISLQSVILLSFTFTISENAYACGWPEYHLAEGAYLFQVLGSFVAALLLCMSFRSIPMVFSKEWIHPRAEAFLILFAATVWMQKIGGKRAYTDFGSEVTIFSIINPLDPIFLILAAGSISLFFALFKKTRECSLRTLKFTGISSLIYGVAIYISFGSFFVPYLSSNPFKDL